MWSVFAPAFATALPIGSTSTARTTRTTSADTGIFPIADAEKAAYADDVIVFFQRKAWADREFCNKWAEKHLNAISDKHHIRGRSRLAAAAATYYCLQQQSSCSCSCGCGCGCGCSSSCTIQLHCRKKTSHHDSAESRTFPLLHLHSAPLATTPLPSSTRLLRS